MKTFQSNTNNFCQSSQAAQEVCLGLKKVEKAFDDFPGL